VKKENTKADCFEREQRRDSWWPLMKDGNYKEVKKTKVQVFHWEEYNVNLSPVPSAEMSAKSTLLLNS
jgi:hypothetical protein